MASLREQPVTNFDVLNPFTAEEVEFQVFFSFKINVVVQLKGDSANLFGRFGLREG